ncbi:bacteriocin-protection protein [Alginatibacterium sediminis]|uniref:Bacteriocin-protection protein n=1 Tax=Alginatibacterium sediminis TaxID=2164068 RepID=A0A420EHA7_9ALTE|nr:YdeI/OmpD-associated family protein [Alginatibacterium sediminis]RKF20050.1 bacteriocin-protection protein [Alginatibacterium sediminis]
MDKALFFKNQKAFNDYLETHLEQNEIWLGYYKKHTGLASISWSESVDVALCYGWIDGIRKTIDDQRYAIRFTPRKMNSVWSAVNVNKVEELDKLGKMTAIGMRLFNNRRDAKGYSSEDRNIALTSEFEALLQLNKPAWKFFINLAPSYKRDSIWWVMSAKKHETRARRLQVLIESSEQSLKIPNLRKK